MFQGGHMNFGEQLVIRLCSLPDWAYACSVTISVSLLYWASHRTKKSAMILCACEVIFCVAFMALCTVCSVLIRLFGADPLYSFNLATDCALTAYCLIWLLLPGKTALKARGVMIGILYATALTLQQTVGSVSVIVESGFGVTGVALEWVRNAVNLLLIAVAAFLVRFSLARFDYIPRSLIVLVGIVAAALFALRQIDSLMLHALESPGDIYLLLVYVLILFVVLLVYYVMFAACRDKNASVEREKERAYLKATETLVRIADSGMRSLREVRHDIRNQISSMAVLFRQKDYAALEKYFSGYAAEVDSRLEYIDCGNAEVNAVLNLERNKAQEAGILFSYNVAVPPSLPLKPSELCSILTNCIDNAVEACVREGQQGAYVRAELRLRGDYLHLYVENPTVKKRPQTETSKADRTSHGYGKRIVKNIVNRYNGAYDERVADGVYKVSVFLDIAGSAPRREDESKDQDRRV